MPSRLAAAAAGEATAQEKREVRGKRLKTRGGADAQGTRDADDEALIERGVGLGSRVGSDWPRNASQRHAADYGVLHPVL